MLRWILRFSHRSLLRFTTLCGALVAILAPATASAALPVSYSLPAAGAYAFTHVDQPPPGANDWTCQPTSAHPRPVVLVHGSLENMAFNWNTASPLLKNAGYCVFALNYGQEDTRLIGAPGSTHPGGSGDIRQSAVELAGFVDQVLAATGASKVDILGHSQGGMMPRWYMKFEGGAAKVNHLVALSPSNHGSSLDGLALLPGAPAILQLGLGEAFRQQAVGSEFMQQLNAGGDTLPGVTYTVIETRYDEVVTPYTSAFLSGPNVTNILLQDSCILDLADHLTTPYDSIALRYVLNALDPAHAVTPGCRVVIAGVGG
jgi:triacylglycerol esterase/lipase EstA (alpha/beta hydrolase family)